MNTQTLKIKARLDKHDKWQEFTGFKKKTTIEEMVNHYKRHLADMPYQFGIFEYRKVALPRYKKTKQFVGQWFLIQMLN